MIGHSLGLTDSPKSERESSLLYPIAALPGSGQTNEFLYCSSSCFPMFVHCGFISITLCRPLPHTKLRGTNPEIDPRSVKFLLNRLLVKRFQLGLCQSKKSLPKSLLPV